MQIEEVKKMEERLDQYKKADRRSQQLAKGKVMLDAIVGDDDHEIQTIVIDIREKRVRYTSVRSDQQSTICAFNREDESEMVTDFLGWAIGQVQSRINAADSEMAEA